MEQIVKLIDSYKAHVNFVANCINCVAMVSFLIFAFGRKNSRIYKYPRLSYLAKFGLTTVALSCLWSAVIFTNPPPSTVLMHVGMSMTFIWAAWFHYVEFVVPAKSRLKIKTKPAKKKKR